MDIIGKRDLERGARFTMATYLLRGVALRHWEDCARKHNSQSKTARTDSGGTLRSSSSAHDSHSNFISTLNAFTDRWFDDNFSTSEHCPRATQLRYLRRGIRLGDLSLKEAYRRIQDINRRLVLFPATTGDTRGTVLPPT